MKQTTRWETAWAEIEWKLRYGLSTWYINHAVWHIVALIPKHIRYFVIMKAFAEATTGPYGNTEPSRLHVFEMIERVKYFD
jgi:hypothetical protein